MKIENKHEINSLNVVKFVGWASAFAIALSGVGIVIYDSNVDHTSDVCLLTKILKEDSNNNDMFLRDATKGEIHQIQAIKIYYKNIGKNVDIDFFKGENSNPDRIVIKVLGEGTDDYYEKVKTLIIK